MADRIDKIIAPALPLEPAGEQGGGREKKGTRERRRPGAEKQEQPPASQPDADETGEKDKGKGTRVNIRV